MASEPKMPRGTSRCGLLGLLGGGGHDVEADEGEEHQRSPGEEAEHAVDAAGLADERREQGLVETGARFTAFGGGRDERSVVVRADVAEAHDDHEEDDRDLERRDHEAEPRRQLGAEGQQRGQDDDQQ